MIDPDGEHITLVDDTGHVLVRQRGAAGPPHAGARRPPDKPTVAAARRREPGGRRRCAAEAGAEIIWTKLSTPHLWRWPPSRGVDFAASQEGGYIFPAFLPAYDAAATFVNLLDLLAQHGPRCPRWSPSLPRIHIVHETVVTPWEQKGMVMRTLVEQAKDRELVLVDGVKVLHDDGWASSLPDPEEPLTHVWAEAPPTPRPAAGPGVRPADTAVGPVASLPSGTGSSRAEPGPGRSADERP